MADPTSAVECPCCGRLEIVEDKWAYNPCEGCDGVEMEPVGHRSTHLYQRLTHKYKSAYKHLDDDRYLVDMQEIMNKTINYYADEAGDDRVTREIIVRVCSTEHTPPDIRATDIQNALYDYFNRTSCSCAICEADGDCCGNWLTSVGSIDHIGARGGWDYWRLQTDSYRNI